MRKIIALLLLCCCIGTLQAEEKEVKLKKKSTSEEPRSLVYVPTVTCDESLLYLYADITMEGVGIVVTNLQTGEVVYSNKITIAAGIPCSILLNESLNENFRIDLVCGGEEYYGFIE